jgi:hypothetical protein
MDSHTCYGMWLVHSVDPEESFWRYRIVEQNSVRTYSLANIISTSRLAEAGLIEDTLESMDMNQSVCTGLIGACAGGHKELALLLVQKYSCHPNWGLRGACDSGNKEMALLMIKKGAYNFQVGFEIASVQGHKELIQLMIQNGAINIRS